MLGFYEVDIVHTALKENDESMAYEISWPCMHVISKRHVSDDDRAES